jgi:hypothetical protein
MTKLIFAPRNFLNAPKIYLGIQPISYVCCGTKNMTRKQQWQAFRFSSSVIRNIVASSKNYIRICKLLLLMFIVVYNPSENFV